MIEIREAMPGEGRSLATVGIRSWESAVVGWGENIAELRPNAHAAYHDFCARQWDRILVAQDHGSIVGWGAREKLDHVISDLWVDPDRQGEGVGARLLGALEDQIRAAGFEGVELETHANNAPAIAFYERLGYRVTSMSVKYAPSLQQDIPKVSMAKQLNPQDDGTEI